MAAHLYQSGDLIVLKDGPLRVSRSNGSCKVLAALPESQGTKRYRVRFDSETFDRSVSEDEIDLTRSPQSGKTLAESKGKIHG